MMQKYIHTFLQTYHRHIYSSLALLAVIVILLCIRLLRTPTDMQRSIARDNIRQTILEQNMHASASKNSVWKAMRTEIASWW